MAKAFAPGNVSCIFAVHEDKNPAKKGSFGVGFTVDKGVFVSAKKSNKTAVYFNSRRINFPTVETVLKKLNSKNESVEIRIHSHLPIGTGFGISGASALAAAYALGKLFKLKKSKKELAKIAHIAEVENGTGLGDVVNQFYGGFLAKLRPSFEFSVKRLPIKNAVVFYKVLGTLDTKKVITNRNIRDKINKAGFNALERIKKIMNADKERMLNEIIKISKEFSVSSGLLKSARIKKIIEKIEKNGGNASMIMLGNSVFSDKFFKGAKKIKISSRGARLL